MRDLALFLLPPENSPPSLLLLAGEALPFDAFVFHHPAVDSYLEQKKNRAVRTLELKLRFPRLYHSFQNGPILSRSDSRFHFELSGRHLHRVWKVNLRQGSPHYLEEWTRTGLPPYLRPSGRVTEKLGTWHKVSRGRWV